MPTFPQKYEKEGGTDTPAVTSFSAEAILPQSYE